MWYIHSIEYYSALKQGNPVVCYKVNLEVFMLNEINKSVTKKTNAACFTYMKNLKKS